MTYFSSHTDQYLNLNFTSGTSYEKYLTDDIYPEDPPIEDSPTDISREDDIDDASTYIDDGNSSFKF